MNAEFDHYSDSYNQYLNNSLSLLGSNQRYFTEYKAKLLKKFLRKNSLLDKEIKVLDFGCGIGNNIPYLSKYISKSKLYGTDISSKSINIAKELYSNICNFKVSDENSLPFEKNYFDLVFISNVFHHIPFNNHDSTLRLIKDVVKINGIVFIIEHNPMNPFTKFIFKNCIFDKDAKMLSSSYLRNIMLNQGFTKTKLDFILFTPPTLKYFSFVDKYFKIIPFGAQYFISAYK